LKEKVKTTDPLLILFNERYFFSLRKDSGKRMLTMKERTSKKVLDYFCEKALDTPILKSRND